RYFSKQVSPHVVEAFAAANAYEQTRRMAQAPLQECLIEIFDQIVGVLETDRQSQESFGGSGSCSLNRCPMFDQAFHAAKAGCTGEDFCFGGDGHCCVTAVLDLKGKHPPEHRHLLCSNLMSRMRLQSGIVDARNFCVSGKETADSHRVFRMPAHPPGEGAHATQNQPAIERRGDRSALVLNTADTLEKLILHPGHDNSSENITMTAEIFCRGM